MLSLAEQEQEEKISQNTLYHTVAGLKVPIAEQMNSFWKEYWNKNKYSPKNALSLTVAEVKVLNK